jgi:6-phosphogluconolactonase
MITEHVYTHGGALVAGLVERVAGDLRKALARRSQASLVVSGGKTPGPFFKALALERLAWERIWITLADERWVDPSDAESNEHLVRTTLLIGEARDAHFVGLKGPAATPEAGAAAAQSALAALPRPFDIVMLGLGEDGHTASLFPGAPELDAALAEDAPDCIAVRPPGAPLARLSLSARTLLDARAIVFLLEGESKWAVYQKARLPGAIEAMPARALLLQEAVPVEVYWAG